MRTLAQLYVVPLVLATIAAVTAPPSNRAPSPASARMHSAARETAMSFVLTSPAFAPGGDIPKPQTCDGKDESPPLAWSGAPAGTRSLALIVDDPDAPDPAAPKLVWVHWVLYNLPAEPRGLPGGITAKTLPKGALEGLNDWKRTGWQGPCPPVGRHRYFFKLYALDTVLPDLKRPTKSALEKSMEGHVLARAELMGHYQRR
jgi:Raf kinase inhibitor-like YbhB/YbcL family protein